MAGSTVGTACRGHRLSAPTSIPTFSAGTLTLAASGAAKNKSTPGGTATWKLTTPIGKIRTVARALAALRAACRRQSAKSSGQFGSGPSSRARKQAPLKKLQRFRLPRAFGIPAVRVPVWCVERFSVVVRYWVALGVDDLYGFMIMNNN